MQERRPGGQDQLSTGIPPGHPGRAGLDAVDRGEHVADTDFMAIDARARYARDPARYERGMTKLLKATVMDTGR